MSILFIHQNFPGQFRNIAKRLSDQPNIVLCIEKPSEPVPSKWSVFRYPIPKNNQTELTSWVLDIESKAIRGEACARAASMLKDKGFTPDLIVGHPGWGELMFIKQIWPHAPVLCYQEFYYQPTGFDYDFDHEYQEMPPGWEARSRLQIKTINHDLGLSCSSWCITPTHFQRSSFPYEAQKKISVIHDGIDTQNAKAGSSTTEISLIGGPSLCKGDSVVTFVNRTLEPYRGCHTFIRSIPHIQKLAPEAQIVVVGDTKGVSYGAPCPDGEWKDIFLREIEGQYDPSRVHFVGKLPYEQFIPLLQISAAHVYLTYPFVLSWSLLEAMSCETPIVGSATAPVMEVIQHGHNGLLVDFFKPNDLAEAVAELLHNRERAQELGRNARQTILQHYSLEKCVPRHLALMDLVASGALGRDPD